MKAIWILGATGRIGRAVAVRLARDGLPLVLVGRDAAKLNRIAAQLGGRGSVSVAVVASLSEMGAAIALQRPGVVVNTIGPFTHTALPIVRACPPGTHYIDISNELPSVLALLALHKDAAALGSTFVTGVGFGVLATESVVLTLCRNRPPAASVRCAAIPSVESAPGPLGDALAASITEGFVYGGRRYEGGQLVRTPLLGDFEQTPLPGGRRVGTASAPTGELEAARRASGASYAVSATSMVPSAAILRAILPSVLSIMKIDALRRFATRRMAAIKIKPPAVKVAHISWSHARVAWSTGEVRQGWMRTGDAMDFSADVMALVATRLIRGEGVPGAYTPGALFGAGLVSECGGEITVDAGIS